MAWYGKYGSILCTISVCKATYSFFHSVVIVVEKEKFWKFTQIFQLWWPWSPQVLKETNCYRPNNEFLFFQCFVSLIENS